MCATGSAPRLEPASCVKTTTSQAPSPGRVGTSISGGACADGNEDANDVTLSGVATGPDAEVFADDVESGSGNFVFATGANDPGGTTPWSVVDTTSHSPTHSFFVAEQASVKDQVVATVGSSRFVGTTGQDGRAVVPTPGAVGEASVTASRDPFFAPNTKTAMITAGATIPLTVKLIRVASAAGGSLSTRTPGYAPTIIGFLGLVAD